MPTYYARKSGNVNATDVWATTPTGTAAAVTFAAGDVLVANSFTVTVNVSTDLGSTGQVRNDTTGGATAGGSFSLSNGVTLTASVFAGSATCVTISGSASATITGNITGGSASNAFGLNVTTTGTTTITGSVTGGTGGSAYGVNCGGGGATTTINITGNMNGGSGSNARGGYFDFQPVVSVTGNVTASANAEGLFHRGTGTTTVTGTVSGAGGNNLPGLVMNFGAGTASIIGTAVGGTSSPGAQNLTTGTLLVTRAKGGSLAGAAVGVAGSTSGIAAVESIEFGDLGASPTSGPIRLTDLASNVAVMYRFNTTKKTLVDTASTSLLPAASNVRSGTVYNAGQTTGTCAVPPAASVLVGVAVDNTVGTAAVSSAAIQSACDAALTAFSSGRLGDVATVASTGQQLANALTP